MEVFIIIAIIVGSIIFLLGLFAFIFGFTYIGIAGHSCASCCQSLIGNVVAGSCFAIMTSLGMKGCFIIMIIIGLLILLSIGIYYLINSGWIQDSYYSVKEFFSNINLPDFNEFFNW